MSIDLGLAKEHHRAASALERSTYEEMVAAEHYAKTIKEPGLAKLIRDTALPAAKKAYSDAAAALAVAAAELDAARDEAALVGIVNPEAKVEGSPPAGFRRKLVTVDVGEVERRAADYGLRFVIRGTQAYDEYLNDYLGWVSLPIEAALEVLRSNGYTPEEAEAVFSSASDILPAGRPVELPRPIKLHAAILVRDTAVEIEHARSLADEARAIGARAIQARTIGTAVIQTASYRGIDPILLEAQVRVEKAGAGLSFNGVSLPNEKECRIRVRSAVESLGLDWPTGRIEVSIQASTKGDISPQYQPQGPLSDGSMLDLPIAIGVIAAMGKIPGANLTGMFIGALDLAGQVKPIRGTIVMAEGARGLGLPRITVPKDNAREASVADRAQGLNVRAVSSLHDVLEAGQGLASGAYEPGERIEPYGSAEGLYGDRPLDERADLNDLAAQNKAKRGMEIAAAAGLNILLVGPPGSGKTMLARRMPGLLPKMSFDQALEVTKIYSVAGFMGVDSGLIAERPFRAPHHTISDAGLIGSRGTARPGEASLADRGVLFLDEINEFRPGVIEALKEPLQTGRISFWRSEGSAVEFPAEFILVGAMNPETWETANKQRLAEIFDLVVHLDEMSAREMSEPSRFASKWSTKYVRDEVEKYKGRAGSDARTLRAGVPDHVKRIAQVIALLDSGNRTPYPAQVGEAESFAQELVGPEVGSGQAGEAQIANQEGREENVRRSYLIVGDRGSKEFKDVTQAEFEKEAEALGFKLSGADAEPGRPTFLNLYGPFDQGGTIRYDTAVSHNRATDYPVDPRRDFDPPEFEAAVVQTIAGALPADAFPNPTVAQVFDWQVFKNLAFDVEHNKQNGYVPGAVLANREYGRQRDHLEIIGRKIRPDFWMGSGYPKVTVGFRDATDMDAMEQLREAIAPIGFSLRVLPSRSKLASRATAGVATGTVTLNKSLAEGFEGLHAKWLGEMQKAGARIPKEWHDEMRAAGVPIAGIDSLDPEMHESNRIAKLDPMLTAEGRARLDREAAEIASSFRAGLRIEQDRAREAEPVRFGPSSMLTAEGRARLDREAAEPGAVYEVEIDGMNPPRDTTRAELFDDVIRQVRAKHPELPTDARVLSVRIIHGGGRASESIPLDRIRVRDIEGVQTRSIVNQPGYLYYARPKTGYLHPIVVMYEKDSAGARQEAEAKAEELGPEYRVRDFGPRYAIERDDPMSHLPGGPDICPIHSDQPGMDCPICESNPMSHLPGGPDICPIHSDQPGMDCPICESNLMEKRGLDPSVKAKIDAEEATPAKWVCLNKKCIRYQTMEVSAPGGGGELNCEICDQPMTKVDDSWKPTPVESGPIDWSEAGAVSQPVTSEGKFASKGEYVVMRRPNIEKGRFNTLAEAKSAAAVLAREYSPSQGAMRWRSGVGIRSPGHPQHGKEVYESDSDFFVVLEPAREEMQSSSSLASSGGVGDIRIVQLELTEADVQALYDAGTIDDLRTPLGKELNWESTPSYGIKSNPIIQGSPTWGALMAIGGDRFTRHDVTGNYVFAKTNAPPSYDMGSTITIGETTGGSRGEPWREVAILKDDEDWHRQRYFSGMYGYERLEHSNQGQTRPTLRLVEPEATAPESPVSESIFWTVFPGPQGTFGSLEEAKAAWVAAGEPRGQVGNSVWATESQGAETLRTVTLAPALTETEQYRLAKAAQSEAPAYGPEENMDRASVIKRIRAGLKQRSGKEWSVTGGTGTAYGWLEISAPPRRRLEHGQLTPEDAKELKELLNETAMPPYSVPASHDHYREYIDRAWGRTPRVHGKQYWD